MYASVYSMYGMYLQYVLQILVAHAPSQQGGMLLLILRHYNLHEKYTHHFLWPDLQYKYHGWLAIPNALHLDNYIL